MLLGEEHEGAVFERLELLLNSRGLERPEAESLPIEFVVGHCPDLFDQRGNPTAAIREQLIEFRPDLVVIDPLRRAHSMDENDSSKMSMLFGGMRGLLQSHQSIWLCHHLRKGTTLENSIDRLRGSTDIAASMDSVLGVSGRFGNLRVRHQKSKRGPEKGEFLVKSTSDAGLPLDYVDLRDESKKRSSQATAFVVDSVRTATPSGGINKTNLLKACRPEGIGKDRMNYICQGLVESNVIKKEKGPRNSTILKMK